MNKLTLSEKGKISGSIKLLYIAKQFLNDCHLKWNSYSKSFILNSWTLSIFLALGIKKLVLVGEVLWTIFSMFLMINIYSNYKIVSTIIVLETRTHTHTHTHARTHTHTQKLIKLSRNSSIEIKVEIVTNLLRLKLYKDKTK